MPGETSSPAQCSLLTAYSLLLTTYCSLLMMSSCGNRNQRAAAENLLPVSFMSFRHFMSCYWSWSRSPWLGVACLPVGLPGRLQIEVALTLAEIEGLQLPTVGNCICRLLATFRLSGYCHRHPTPMGWLPALCQKEC